MRGHDVGDAFIRVLISFAALNGPIQHQDRAMMCGFEDEDVLELGLLRVKDFLDFQGLGHALPLIADFAEPSVCEREREKCQVNCIQS